MDHLWWIATQIEWTKSWNHLAQSFSWPCEDISSTILGLQRRAGCVSKFPLPWKSTREAQHKLLVVVACTVGRMKQEDLDLTLLRKIEGGKSKKERGSRGWTEAWSRNSWRKKDLFWINGQTFSSMINCYRCFEPVASKKHPNGRIWWKKDAHLMAAGGEKSMAERRMEVGIKEGRQR